MQAEIIAGDCLDVMATIEPGSVNLVFADPPYNVGVPYDVHNDRMEPAAYLAWCDRWICASVRTLAPDGSMWVLINDEWADEYGIMLRQAGLVRRSRVIWYETFGVNCTRKFNRTHRHLFHMVRDRGRFTFNRAAVSIPSARLAKYRDKRANPEGKILDDVWTIPRLAGTHSERIKAFPTQLPLALLRRIVGCSSNPGDLVADWFSGSGTTAAVCVESGRRFLGVELSANYADLSRKRLDGITARFGCVA